MQSLNSRLLAPLVLFLMVFVLPAASVQAAELDLSTPQKATVAWIKSIANDDRESFLAVSSTYGQVGEFYADIGTPLGFSVIRQMFRESFGSDAGVRVLIALLDALEEMLPVLYVADNVAIVQFDPLTEKDSVGTITVLEDGKWKVSVLLPSINVSFYESFL